MCGRRQGAAHVAAIGSPQERQVASCSIFLLGRSLRLLNELVLGRETNQLASRSDSDQLACD